MTRCRSSATWPRADVGRLPDLARSPLERPLEHRQPDLDAALALDVLAGELDDAYDELKMDLETEIAEWEPGSFRPAPREIG